MHKYQFHEKWILPFLLCLIGNILMLAQCPLTKSTSFAMVEKGLPSLDRIQPLDFLVHLDDTLLFSDLSLDRNHFLCKDVGIQEVLLSGRNITGTAFTCEEYVWVFDSVLLCSNSIITPMAVGGKVTTELNEIMPNVAIALLGEEINYFKGTNERGAFFFENFEPLNYRLKPDFPFDNYVRNGISTFDVLLLQKHILNLRPLGSPYKLIAADLNNSGDITAFDMLLLRQMILSIIDGFPKTPSWKFVDANYEFENEENPFEENVPKFIPLDMKNLGPQLDNRFIAIKMGDLNNSAKVNAVSGLRTSNLASNHLFLIENQHFSKGEIVEIPFAVNQNLLIEGLQFSLTFDPSKLEFVEIIGGFDLKKSDYFIKDGTINISWIDVRGREFFENEVPISLIFRTIENGFLSDALSLKKEAISPEIYTSNLDIFPFDIDWVTDKSTGFQAFNNFPNPFSLTTTIPFSLPKSSEVILRIFDANGQQKITKKHNFSSGFHSFIINEELSVAGLYFYKIESSSGMISGKMNYIGR